MVDGDPAAGERGTNDTRECRSALKTGGAALDPDRSVGFECQRPFSRIDGEPHFHSAVVAAAAPRKSVGVVLAFRRAGPFDLERTPERPHLAAPTQPFDDQLGAARRRPDEQLAV